MAELPHSGAREAVQRIANVLRCGVQRCGSNGCWLEPRSGAVRSGRLVVTPGKRRFRL
jgi:hypothetical protein